MWNLHKIMEIAEKSQLVGLILLVFLLSCIGCATKRPLPVSQKKSQVIILSLYYSNGAITEKSINIIPGFISQNIDPEPDSTRYTVKIYGQRGEVLHAVSETPSIICYDYLSESGELKGGTVNMPEKDWVLRLPVSPNMAKIQIISPHGKTVFLRNFTQKEIEKLK